MNEMKQEQELINDKNLFCGKTNGKIYDFTVFKDSIKFASVIFNKHLLNDAQFSK